MTKYTPVKATWEGDKYSLPTKKLPNHQETPRMTKPMKYERPGKKTRS